MNTFIFLVYSLTVFHLVDIVYSPTFLFLSLLFTDDSKPASLVIQRELPDNQLLFLVIDSSINIKWQNGINGMDKKVMRFSENLLNWKNV